MIIPYIDNNYFLLFPQIPTNCEKPPTIYTILESIVNYGKDEKTKIRDMAKVGRTTIFNFDYPLTDNISKEKFETMILNHFLMRRIGFETVEAFRIQLYVKLNEIMPMYNIMFDSIKNWNLFNDGEITKRYGTDDTTSNTKNELENKSITESQDISDKRNSELPQNRLDEVRSGEYVTDYNYDTNTANSNDTSTSNGKSESVNNNKYNETIEKSPANKIELMKEFQENIKSIYSMIFKDLECLFYQLV